MGNNVEQAFLEDDGKDKHPLINPESSFLYAATSFKPSINSVASFQAITSGSAATLGGTITALEGSLSDIRQYLPSTSKYASSEDFKDLKGNFDHLSVSVAQIEALIPNLQTTQNNIQKVTVFFDTYQGILADIISGEGKLKGFEEQLTTLNKRIGQVEDQRAISITLKYTGLGIIITLILGAIDFAIRYYLGK
jgi:hypothetical protein